VRKTGVAAGDRFAAVESTAIRFRDCHRDRRRLDRWRILARFLAQAAHLQPTCLMKVSK